MFLGKIIIIGSLINTCWYFFKLAALLVVIGVVGMGVYLFTQMDNEIRRHVQRTLSEHFPQWNVSVGGARLVEGQGIAIYDLTISETTSTRLQNNLLVVDEIMLVCDAQLSELLKGVPRVEQVVVKHPQLWVSRRTNGKWNFESLFPLPSFGDSRPQIVIEDAQITFDDQRQARLPPLLLRDVNLSIGSSDASPQGTSRRQSTEISQANHEEPANVTAPLEIHGTWGGPNVRRAEIHAQYDPARNSLRLATTFQQLQITPDLLAWLTAYAPAQVGQLTLQGQVDGNVTVEHQLGGQTTPRFDTHMQLTGGHFSDPRLPRPLTELSCNIRCDNHGAKIEQLRGNLGSARFAMQLERRGWQTTAPLALGLRLENVPLDKELYDALPALLQQQWDKYQPTGIVDGDLQLTFDGTRWRPRVALAGRDLAFESDKFRYRVNNGSGTLRYELPQNGGPAKLDIDLIGYGGGQPLKIVGQVLDPKPKAAGWVEITGQNIDIQQRMIDAMPEKTRNVIQSLHPEGQFHLRWRLARTRPGQPKLRTSMQLELVDCRVKYDKFPYPLSGINGLILAEDRHWTFRDLASGGSRSVQCQGYLRPIDVGNKLELHFTGQQIPLDDDLQHALPESVRKAWEELHPSGRVDLIADMVHKTGDTRPSIRVSVRPRPESATIQPKFFPYLLEQVEGSFDYFDGQLLMSNVRARHGPTTVRTNGSGNFDRTGAWQVQLEGLSADRLVARRDLIVALPPKLQKLIDRLKPSGSFSLYNGSLTFSKSRSTETTIDSQWDVQLDCHQSDFQVGIDLRNVHGSVRLVGASRAGQCYSSGELALDSATFLDVQFTDIQGPLWVDDTSCRLGRWATERQNLSARRMTAKVYDGYLVADGWATFDGLPEYGVQASLAGANLLRMMTERFNGQREFKGKVAANVNLRGRGRSLDNLVGKGDVKITDANIYELPLLVGLLKVLRNSKPDTTAFNKSNVKFRIQGRHIYLDQLDFLGDAVSLFGKGYTNFNHQLNLVFHGVIGRNEFRLPLVKNFVGQASQQIMQMYVDGTLDDPQIHTQALPGINNLIQQIQDDLDATGAAIRPREANRTFPALPRWGR